MYYIIANPSSRSGQKSEVLPRLKTMLQEKGESYRVIRTQGPGHARRAAGEIEEVAAKAGGVAKVVILGGDGTINEFLSGISDYSRICLGIVPTGSGNDMARGLELPGEKEILARIVDGRMRRRMDVGTVKFEKPAKGQASAEPDRVGADTVFAVSCGFGFDAAVCEQAIRSRVKKALNSIGLGTLSYGAIALQQLYSVKDAPCTIETIEGKTYSFDRILLAAMMNLQYQGGGYRFAPDAKIDDGLLNVSVISALSVPKKLVAFQAAATGKHYDLKEVTHFRTAGLTIRMGAPRWVHTDGEVTTMTEGITVGIIPRALALMV